MSTYQYMSVPFAGSTKDSDTEPGKTLAEQLQRVMNNGAPHGWEFYSINTVHISVAPGCLPALLEARSTLEAHDMIIFRKVIAAT